MSILDGAIAFDRKRAERAAADADAAFRERVAAELAEIKELLQEERRQRRLAESRLNEERARRERLEEELAQVRKLKTPKSTVKDQPQVVVQPSQPVAYKIEVQRGGDGLIKTLEMIPRGSM